jgi:hypothetical protein
MNYRQYVLDTFRDHEDSIGVMSSAEIEDTISAYKFENIERWLVRSGYDLKNMYEADNHE